MTEKYTFIYDEFPNPDDVQVIRDGLTAFNLKFVPDAQYKKLNIFLRDEGGLVVGGLIGNTYWGWLYVSLLWLAEPQRGCGLGQKMLLKAEEEALRRGCRRAHLDTLDFQALAFYEAQGYSVFGRLDDLPYGHSRYFLQKTLLEADA